MKLAQCEAEVPSRCPFVAKPLWWRHSTVWRMEEALPGSLSSSRVPIPAVAAAAAPMAQ